MRLLSLVGSKGIAQHGIFLFFFFSGLLLVGSAAAAVRALPCIKQCVWEFSGSDNIHLNARTELCTEAMIRCYQFSPVCLYFSTLFTETLSFYPHHTGAF